jgi:GT2 family glycosyltransferase
VNVAAVVVRWRGGDEVGRCLASLLAFGGDKLSRIILVDSGSGDGGADRLAATFPEVEVLALDANRSFAHAANRGIATVDEELIFLLNPDTEVVEDSVSTLTAAAARRPGSAGIVPLLVNPDGSSQHRWQLRRLPTVGRLAAGRPGAPACSRPPERDIAIEQPAAAAWLVRRDVWKALDGFDESFTPAWWEDVDLCARLAGKTGDPGFPADGGFVVSPDARVVHVGGSSVNELGRADFLKAYYGNLLRYADRHHGGQTALIRLGLRCSLIGRSVLKPSLRPVAFGPFRSVGRPGAGDR